MKDRKRLEKLINRRSFVNEELKKLYCEQILEAIQESGISKHEFASVTGISEETLDLIEDGAYKGSTDVLRSALNQMTEEYKIAI
jgi:ribosome-binding protein aMBF1 (putative translation factor)